MKKQYILKVFRRNIVWLNGYTIYKYLKIVKEIKI